MHLFGIYIYIFLSHLPAYIYVYIYSIMPAYIYTYIYIVYIDIFSTLNFDGVMPEKALKYAFFQKYFNQNHFWIFSKISSEMNSTHPFYRILISNTSYVKNFMLFVGGSKGVPKLEFVRRSFLLKHRFCFVLGVPKMLWKGVIILNFFFS